MNGGAGRQDPDADFNSKTRFIPKNTKT